MSKTSVAIVMVFIRHFVPAVPVAGMPGASLCCWRGGLGWSFILNNPKNEYPQGLEPRTSSVPTDLSATRPVATRAPMRPTRGDPEPVAIRRSRTQAAS